LNIPHSNLSVVTVEGGCDRSTFFLHPEIARLSVVVVDG
jgi:hypothetical protein